MKCWITVKGSVVDRAVKREERTRGIPTMLCDGRNILREKVLISNVGLS